MSITPSCERGKCSACQTRLIFKVDDPTFAANLLDIACTNPAVGEIAPKGFHEPGFGKTSPL
jgi:hypothetical protein